MTHGRAEDATKGTMIDEGELVKIYEKESSHVFPEGSIAEFLRKELIGLYDCWRKL